jgi:hypothetical protein
LEIRSPNSLTARFEVTALSSDYGRYTRVPVHSTSTADSAAVWTQGNHAIWEPDGQRMEPAETVKLTLLTCS